ncbi:denticleless protein homolog [Lingula anatina]|uniref:Denticleless protein homolog n=1 Tax=Lingula anatina TaxID=7574 RepID=A0A1S3JDR2_LINAN|nr:denticleless protein homolog [Lingula anatina]|eukprot:XP_013408542.1 denticleless protein homolog [Lingula anatina]
MALLSRLFAREATASFGKEGTLTSCLDRITEDFRCYSFDQHLIEGQEYEIIPPFACSFCKVPGSLHFLAVADEDGTVVLYNLNKTGTEAVVKDWSAHSNAIFDVSWVIGENKILTASGDQTIALWDVETSQKLAVFRGHTSSVKSISSRWNDPYIFSSGSRDGHIMLWDTRCSKKDGSIPSVNIVRNAHLTTSSGSTPKPKKRTKLGPAQDSQQSVTSVLFQDENHLVSAGAVDGTVKVWDMRKNYSVLKMGAQPMHNFPYNGSSIRKHGFSNLAFDSSRTKLFASCTDDHIYQYNCASYTSKSEGVYKGHRNSTFYVKACVSPDDRFLLSGSSDNNAYMWKIDDPLSSPVLLKGHLGEVTSVAWNPADFTQAVTLSDDSTMRVWRLYRHSTADSERVTIGHAERAPQTKVSPSKNLKPPSSSGQKVSPHKDSRVVRNVNVNPTTLSVTANLSNTRNMTAKLVPVTLTKWLNRTGKVDSALMTSPRKPPPPSPRKLIISPMKRPSVPTPVRSVGIKRQHSSGELMQRNKVAKTVTNGQVEYGNALDEVNYNSPEKVNQDSSGDLCFSETVKTPQGAKKQLFSSDFKEGETVHKLKTIESSLTRSPTSNLPNWVLNPEPRVPQAPQNKENSPKSIDWLTKISLQRRGSVTLESGEIGKKTAVDNACGKLKLKVRKERILSKEETLDQVKGSPKSVSRSASPTSPLVASPRNRSILSFFKQKPK